MNAIIVPLECLTIPLPRLYVHVIEVLHVFNHVSGRHNNLVRQLRQGRCRTRRGVQLWPRDRILLVSPVDVKVNTRVTELVCAGEGHTLRFGRPGASDFDVEAADEVLKNIRYL